MRRGYGPRRAAAAIATLLLFAAGITPAQPVRDTAQWRERCKTWIERKGYPVDHIQQKTGRRQPGMAASWKGNVPREQVQVGDVAIRSLSVEDGRTLQVAGYVEAVEPASGSSEIFLTLSAMALGGKTLVDGECFVTESFGQVSQHRVPLSAVLRVWRPSLPLE